MADEKFYECVRQFPVIYDKECKDFKDKNKKQKAWEMVANTMGMKKEDAISYFRNMRNKYSREKKKLCQVKVSRAGKKDVDDVKKELSDMFHYLTWLDPYARERKTKSNLMPATQDDGASDSENEVSDVSLDRSETPDPESTSDTSNTKKEEIKSWKFHKHTARDTKKIKLDREEAEFALIKSLGESIANQKEAKGAVKQRDDNDIFGELIVSQLKLLPPERNVMVKMQISNLIYQNMMPPAANYSHTPVMMQDQGNTYLSF